MIYAAVINVSYNAPFYQMFTIIREIRVSHLAENIFCREKWKKKKKKKKQKV